MTTKGGGRPPKSAKIDNNFNVKKKRGYVPTKADLLQASLQAQIEADQKSIAAKEIESLTAQIVEMKKTIGIDDVDRSTPTEPEDEIDTDGEDDVKSAYQMLQDMRWVYKQCKGRTKLKDLMKDDKQFITLAKELIKVETSLLTAKTRSSGGGGGNGRQSFFVVLKGLETERPIVAAMNSGAIDIKQIANALNPQAMTRYESDDVKSAREKPAEIIKVVKRHEDEEAKPVAPVEKKPITIQDVEGW